LNYLKKAVFIALMLTALCLVSGCIGNFSNFINKVSGISKKSAKTGEDSMNINVEDLKLSKLSFYHRGMNLYQVYNFNLKEVDGEFFFSANFNCEIGRIFIESTVIESSVFEAIEKMVKESGNIYGPDIYDGPDPKLQVMDASTWGYTLTWSDGTLTNAGGAKNEIMDYLKELAIQINEGN